MGVTEGKEKKGRGNVAGERHEQGRGGSREEEDTNGGLAIAALCTSRQALHLRLVCKDRDSVPGDDDPIHPLCLASAWVPPVLPPAVAAGGWWGRLRGNQAQQASRVPLAKVIFPENLRARDKGLALWTSGA